jgi:hypothetical protein
MQITISDAGLLSIRLGEHTRSVKDLEQLRDWIQYNPTAEAGECRALGVIAGFLAGRDLRASGQTISASNAARYMDEYHLVFGSREANEAFSEGIAQGTDAARREATIPEVRDLVRGD